jgi:hypothetical protein
VLARRHDFAHSFAPQMLCRLERFAQPAELGAVCFAARKFALLPCTLSGGSSLSGGSQSRSRAIMSPQL